MSDKTQQFREQYNKQTDTKLRYILQALEGQPQNVAATLQRMTAIKDILNTRESRRKQILEDEKKLIEGTPKEQQWDWCFDEVVANKYLWKKRNAEERGIEFSLTLSDVSRLMRRKKCYYTGVELLDHVAARHPHKRTFDRVDSSIGYHRGNVVACTFSANYNKELLLESPSNLSKMTQQQLLKMFKKLTGK